MIVPAVPTYLSKAFPAAWSGMSGCGMGEDCYDPLTGESLGCSDPNAVGTDVITSYGPTAPPGSYSTSGGTVVPQPINVTVNNPAGGGGSSASAPWYDQLIASLGLMAGKSLLPAAGTAIQAQNLKPGQSLYTNPNTGQTSIVSSTGQLVSSSTSLLSSLLPLILIGGAVYLVVSMAKR